MDLYLLIIFVLLIVVAALIWLIWHIETTIPSIPKQNKRASITQIELEWWFKLLGEKKKFNGIVSLTRKGEIVFECFLGFKDTELKHRIDQHTRFRLASVSKQFTAFGVMTLLKKYPLEGGFETLIKDIIPEFPYPDVSIRHLLNQTSGIEVDYISLAKKNQKGKQKILTIQDALDLVCHEKVENPIQPATKFSYNNTNYVILAALIERVCGISFEEFMKKEVFDPLNLEDTMVWNMVSKTSLESLDNIAIDFEQYLGSKPRLIEPTWIDGVAGDGGIFSSLHDLREWMKILESNPIFTAHEMSDAFQKPKLRNGEKSEYGFGWVVEGDYIWHDGKWLATNSFVMKDRSTDTVFIMIDNASNLRFDKILYSVKELVFKSA